jgi:hypothetical protein
MPQVPAYPFQNQFPTLAPNEPIDPAKLVALAAQVAVSADGRLHSELAPLKNWKKTTVSLPDPLAQGTLVREPVSRRWLALGSIALEAAVTWTVSGTSWILGTTLGGSPALQHSPLSSAVNSDGIILVGGAPFTASTGKLRESTDGGETWTTRHIGLADTLAAKALTYVPQLSLWLCMVGGLSGGVGAGIYTSTDRITWTFRNSAVYSHFATKEFGSPIIIGSTHNFFAASNTYTRSVDGINWVPQTGPWPENSVCRGCWSEEHGFVVGSFTGIWKSTTALTGEWTKISNDSIHGGSSIGAFGRALMRGDGYASLDGRNWIQVLELASSDHAVVATDFGVGVCRGASRELYISHQVGF